MARPFGSKTRPPVVMTDEMARKLVEKKKEVLHNSPSLVKMAASDREYLRGMFQALVMVCEDHIEKHKSDELRGSLRYTPAQMWHNTKKYFEVTIEYGQPLTIMGIALFNGLERQDLQTSTFKEMPEAFHFLKNCTKFVEMYNEFAAHRKQNPAGPIFILKNFGWKDKFEIEASSNPGALSEADRAEAQKRIGNFTEDSVTEKIIKGNV